MNGMEPIPIRPATTQAEPDEEHLDEGAGRILIIDDEPVVADVLRGVLGSAGHRIEVAVDATTGRQMLEEGRGYDAVLLDVMLPDADGLDVLRWIHERDPELGVVMITAHGTVQSAVTAMKSGAYHYVTKPFHNDEVRLLVAQAVASTRLRTENRNLKRVLEEHVKFEKIVGKSRAMLEVYGFIDQVAKSRSTVLIQGESGTGKELVAQAIHRRSPRADKPFVVVNSSTIPQDLLEDNLFGHVRGAFTGANASKIGLLQAAHGGTIVFDEITTVTPAVQAKLLRVIQEKEFIPLGSVESRSVDVRIIAATNEDVRQLVDEGRFREDLYYRLNVISMTLPPLRVRDGDLPLLVAHFLERCNAENGTDVKRVSSEVLARFAGYTWPGNVRELENVIERGVVLARATRSGWSSCPRSCGTAPRLLGACCRGGRPQRRRRSLRASADRNGAASLGWSTEGGGGVARVEADHAQREDQTARDRPLNTWPEIP